MFHRQNMQLAAKLLFFVHHGGKFAGSQAVAAAQRIGADKAFKARLQKPAFDHAAIAAALSLSAAQAQDYPWKPDRPVTVIVPPANHGRCNRFNVSRRASRAPMPVG